MLESLKEIDILIFEWWNGTCSNSVFDLILPFLRHKSTWIPLYGFLLIFFPIKYKKDGIFWFIGFGLCVALGDFISAGIFKPFFERLRPCNEQNLFEEINVLVHCGKAYSFVSSHACNHFAMGAFAFFTLRNKWAFIKWLPLTWAFLISISQVYVGVHYPFDILVGGIIGFLIGYAMSLLFKKYFCIK